MKQKKKFVAFGKDEGYRSEQEDKDAQNVGDILLDVCTVAGRVAGILIFFLYLERVLDDNYFLLIEACQAILIKTKLAGLAGVVASLLKAGTPSQDSKYKYPSPHPR